MARSRLSSPLAPLITAKDTQNDTVFTIAIVEVPAASGNFQLQLTQLEAIKHSDTDLFDEVATLLLSGQGAVQLQLEVTRTDGDGDVVTDFDQIDLITNEGSQFFSFDDDGPTLTVAATTDAQALGALALNVDETDDTAGTDRYNPADVVDNRNPDGNGGAANLGQVTTAAGDPNNGGLKSLFAVGGDAGSDKEASLTGTLSFHADARRPACHQSRGDRRRRDCA